MRDKNDRKRRTLFCYVFNSTFGRSSSVMYNHLSAIHSKKEMVVHSIEEQTVKRSSSCVDVINSRYYLLCVAISNRKVALK